MLGYNLLLRCHSQPPRPPKSTCHGCKNQAPIFGLGCQHCRVKTPNYTGCTAISFRFLGRSRELTQRCQPLNMGLSGLPWQKGCKVPASGLKWHSSFLLTIHRPVTLGLHLNARELRALTVQQDTRGVVHAAKCSLLPGLKMQNRALPVHVDNLISFLYPVGKRQNTQKYLHFSINSILTYINVILM